MTFLMISGIVIAVVWAYVMFVRPEVLAKFPKLQAMESKLWASSRQILFARVYWIGGIVVGLHDFVLQSGADASTLLGEISHFLPEKYQALALAGFLFFSGIMMEWLRKVTTGPVGSSAPVPAPAPTPAAADPASK